MMPGSFWLAHEPLVLASGSPARRMLLEGAAIPVEIRPVPIDEGAIAAPLVSSGLMPIAIAEHLAAAKAGAAATLLPGRIVLAADQTLELDGALFVKARGLPEARAQLARLRGRAHALHSAAILRRDDEVLWTGCRSARLAMREVSDTFLDRYLAAMGGRVLQTVGGYELESLGIQLFQSIEGDHATILGLPLLDVLAALRQLGFLLD